MKHGSLFSGIGGFDLAASWCGWQNIWQVEIDPYCRAVLQKHFPETKRYEDIKNVKGISSNSESQQDRRKNKRELRRNTTRESQWSEPQEGQAYLETVDIISGGFPCQPFSVAGKQAGKEDNRYLWPEMLRVIAEVTPAWVVAENVAGIINMELESVLASLEAEGYEVWPLVIPACAIGAPHRRDRVWILGHTKHDGLDEGASRPNRKKWSKERQNEGGESQRASDVADTKSYLWRTPRNEGHEAFNGNSTVGDTTIERLPDGICVALGKSRSIKEPKRSDWWSIEPDVGRVADGIPRRVDRLKGLGNAIVPQVAYQIFKAIDEIERGATP